MNKTAVILILVFLGLYLCVNTSNSQSPYIAVYFDRGFECWARVCPEDAPYTKFDTLYVVARNFDEEIISVEYKIDYTWALYFFTDIVDPGYSSEGTSPAGITISFPSPLNGFEPQLVQRTMIWWVCTANDCHSLQIPVRVLPHPASGRIGAVRSLDFTFIDAIGWTSLICPPLSPVESGTWGHIKSLYH